MFLQALLCTIDSLTELLEGDMEYTRLVLPLLSNGLIDGGAGLAPAVLAWGARLLATVGAASARKNDRWVPG